MGFLGDKMEEEEKIIEEIRKKTELQEKYPNIFRDIEIRDYSDCLGKIYFLLCDLEKSLRNQLKNEQKEAINWKVDMFDKCFNEIRDKVKLIEYIHQIKEEFFNNRNGIK